MQQLKEKKEALHIETKWKQAYNGCIARSQKPLSQLPTRSPQGVYSVHYAASRTINPVELECAGLSFLPIAESGHCPERWRADGKDWNSTYGVSDWKPESWRCSYGIQVFTGSPSGDIMDLDFEFAMIRDHRDIFMATLQQLCALVDNPLLVITKRGGLRFSVRTPGYVHPLRERIAVATWKNHRESDRLYLEIFGEKGLSRYDARYEIVSGSLLNMPIADYRPVLEIVDALREQIGTPKPEKPISVKSTTSSQQHNDVSSVKSVDALPSNLRWVERSDGSLMSLRSDYPCQVTKHTKSAGSAQYYRQLNGQIDAFCHNCQEPWIVERSDNSSNPKQAKRYTVDNEHQHTTSKIDTERSENKSVLENWLHDTEDTKGKHLLILGSAAGTGKTTAGVTTAETLLYVAKTTEEADNVFEFLQSRGEDVIRHRPRMFNRGHKDFDNQPDWETLPLGIGENKRPCIHPEVCNTLAESGHATTVFCVKCPVYAECQENGYLSQAKKERNTSKVIYAWKEVTACDETYKGLVKRICTADDILIVDEVNPLELTQARQLDRDTLFDLTERFQHNHASTRDVFKTLETLRDLLSTAPDSETFINGLEQWIDSMENDIKGLDEKIENYPVGIVISETPAHRTHERFPFEASITYQNQEVTVPVVVDFQTADDTPAYFIDPESPIETDRYQIRFVSLDLLLKVGLVTLEDPPRKHRKLLADVKAFFDENANIATAPFTFDPKRQTFEFHLKPTLNHHRTIFNTASDSDNLIGEAYRETDINITRHTGTPPAWKTDLVFQIASGTYLPRHSLLRKEGNTLYLKQRAQELVDAYIRPSIGAGLKVLVVAPKAFQDVESVKQWAVTEMDDFIEGHNALLINHHHAEGRNDYQDFDIVFIFHYEPNHNEIPLATKRIYRNPQTLLDFTREKQTVTLGGVRFEKVVYKDERVQAVFNRECRARLMQSAMRLRPNLDDNEGKIVVFLTAEPVDIPVTTRAIDAIR